MAGAGGGGGARVPPMDGGEDRTFKANFTGEGVTMLQDRVKEKLRELMGDYSDDTLAVSAPPPSSLSHSHTAGCDTRSVAKTLASHMPSVECGSVAGGGRSARGSLILRNLVSNRILGIAFL